MSCTPHVDVPTDTSAPPSTLDPRSNKPDVEPEAPAGSVEVLEPAPQFTIVIPTRNESDNVEPILRRRDAVLTGVSTEIVFVDDRDDGTADAIRAAAADSADQVRLLHRPAGERSGGPGGAVLAGIAVSA